MKIKNRFSNWQMPEILHGQQTKYGWVVLFPENLILSKHVDIGYGTFINAKHGVIIAEEVEIGPYCCILSDNSINNKSGCIIINSGVKIGAYSLILPNSIIKRNSFIKARSNVVGIENDFIDDLKDRYFRLFNNKVYR